MALLEVLRVSPVGSVPGGHVVVRTTEPLAVGVPAELRKPDGRTFRGTVKGLDFHQPAPDQYALFFSEGIRQHIEPGDIVALGR